MTETIVILTPGFPENESATHWVTSQQLLVRALKRNFPRCDIAVLSFSYPYFKAEYEWHDIKVASFNGMRYRKLKRFVLWWKIWKRLEKIRREKNVTGILSFWCGECTLIGSYFGRFYSIKHYCWICGQDAKKRNRYVKFIRPKSNELIAISDFVADKFYRSHRIRPQYVIPNAIDQDVFPSIPAGNRDIELLAVGSLIAAKQYDIFITVIKTLWERFPGIRAIHCGEGEEKENIKALIDKFGISNNVSLLGEQRHEEVLKLMQRSKILLHPSAYEGFSTVCLEALYSGAHVISFTKPMDHEIKNWHIVRTHEEMAEKALEILENPLTEYRSELLYSMNGTARAIRNLFDKG